jgi:GNAT superfamily N-acetyltransferase
MTADGLGEPTFLECAGLDSDVFELFYREVLEPAFPHAELEDLGKLSAGYLNPSEKYHGEVALRAGQPVGGALGEYYSASRVMLLGYLAVRGDQRGTGLGSALIRTVLDQWQRTVQPLALVAEVENPRYHGETAHGDPVARLRFYERLGAKLVPFSYFQPSVEEQSPRVRGMFLLSLDPRQETMPTAALLSFLDEYMLVCEGEGVVGVDPEYVAMCAQIAAWRDEIPLWPMSWADRVVPNEYEVRTGMG